VTHAWVIIGEFQQRLRMHPKGNREGSIMTEPMIREPDQIRQDCSRRLPCLCPLLGRRRHHDRPLAVWLPARLKYYFTARNVPGRTHETKDAKPDTDCFPGLG
jgi:hypothetical protein